jgi:hypothetical protein
MRAIHLSAYGNPIDGLGMAAAENEPASTTRMKTSMAASRSALTRGERT